MLFAKLVPPQKCAYIIIYHGYGVEIKITLVAAAFGVHAIVT